MTFRSVRLLAALAGALVALGVAVPDVSAQRIQQGKWRVGDEPEGWTVFVTRDYQVQSEVERERAEAVVSHVEAMMREYHRRFYTRKPLKDFVLKIFADRRGYVDYGGSPGSLAYYSDRGGELVCFDTGSLEGLEGGVDAEALVRLVDRLTEMGMPPEFLEDVEIQGSLGLLARPKLLGVLAHEAWHQYFHFWIVSKVEFPSWLDEGLGDYFYTAQVSEDGREVECGILNPMRFPTIWLAIRNERHVPIRELLRYRQRQYYRNPALCYAQGWSMVYFCYHGGHDRYARIPDTLIRAFKVKHDMDEATDIAFRGIDIDRFEKEWIDFYMAMDFKESLHGMVRDLLGIDVSASPLTTPDPKPAPGGTPPADPPDSPGDPGSSG
jgi:hypothetical protein